MEIFLNASRGSSPRMTSLFFSGIVGEKLKSISAVIAATVTRVRSHWDRNLGDGAGFEQQLIGQRALAVVDVRNDREVADELWVH